MIAIGHLSTSTMAFGCMLYFYGVRLCGVDFMFALT